MATATTPGPRFDAQPTAVTAATTTPAAQNTAPVSSTSENSPPCVSSIESSRDTNIKVNQLDFCRAFISSLVKSEDIVQNLCPLVCCKYHAGVVPDRASNRKKTFRYTVKRLSIWFDARPMQQFWLDIPWVSRINRIIFFFNYNLQNIHVAV